MNWRWFASGAVRVGSELLRRVEKMLRAQEDILQPAGIDRLRQACAEFEAKLKGNTPDPELKLATAQFEKTAQSILKPYPNANIRENVDVILVALAVALAIRTFFLQPMAIPTGSMQPTLYGITHENLIGTGAEVPGLLSRIWAKAFRGESYIHVVAKTDGEFKGAAEPRTHAPLVKSQIFQVGPQIYKVWFPPDQMLGRAGLMKGRTFRKGEDIIKMKVRSGDHLFVNRLTYNFRRPERGEIVIFESTGVPMLTQDTHYIKRLIARGGETVQIGNDRHVIINGRRLDASTPLFENVYSFDGPPKEDRYSGHVNDFVGQQIGRPPGGMGPIFPDETEKFNVRQNHFFVLGDNTLNSYDSRYWRDFPQEKVIGKHAFVFWPISERFGWGVR